VTPVSQFYFQQAFSNAMRGKWSVIDKNGYGKMVLGYFGKTPVAPDPQVVKWASEQLKLEPTTKAVVEINDANPKLGIKAATAVLEQNSLPVTDENIFIIATCGDKGLAFLKGDKPMGIRYKEEKKAAKKNGASAYTVAVGGKSFNVQVNGGKVTVDGKTFDVSVATGAAAAAAPKASSGSGAAFEVTSPIPGTVTKIIAPEGTQVEAGATIVIIEAMKMETEIKTEKAGRVSKILVNVKDVVTADQAIATIEE